MEGKDMCCGSFRDGYKQAKRDFLAVLDKWMEHAIRGMEKGATAYHQGKIALILDLKDWISERECYDNDR